MAEVIIIGGCGRLYILICRAAIEERIGNIDFFLVNYFSSIFPESFMPKIKMIFLMTNLKLSLFRKP